MMSILSSQPKECESAVYLLKKYSCKNMNVEFVKEAYNGDDFKIDFCADTVKVSGNTAVAFNAAVGKLLHGRFNGTDCYKCHFENEIRGIYFANHFYNYYHSAPIEKVCEYIESLALWGQSVIQLWFDMHHFASLDDAEAKDMIYRMKEIFKKAKSLGMKTSLTRVANEYFDIGQNEFLAQNSLENGLYKTKLNGYYYTELCPSKEGGRKMIADCFNALLSEFSDIGLDYLCLWPYDQGGCTCRDCYPWGANGFYKLSKELARGAKRIFPYIKIIESAWFFDLFTDGEWDAFIDTAKEDDRWFDFVMVNICDPVPERIKELNVPVISFPEISMQGAVPWGGFGANPLPCALKKQFDLSNDYCSGGIMYSEGIYDDINKIISLELFRDPSLSIDDILLDYCSFYFGETYANELAQLIKMLEPTLYRGRYEADGNRNDYPLGEQKEIPAIRFEHPETLEKIKNLFLDIDSRLPGDIKENWRYKILWIRAVGDYELYKNNGYANEITDKIFGKLREIYFAEKAFYFLAPYTRESILENRGHI